MSGVNLTWSLPLRKPAATSSIPLVLGKLPRKLKKKLKKQKYSMTVDIQENNYGRLHQFFHSWDQKTAPAQKLGETTGSVPVRL